MTTTNPQPALAQASGAQVPTSQTNAVTEEPAQPKLVVESPIASDLMFGSSVLLVVIMFHAFLIRYITGEFLRRAAHVGPRAAWWHADMLFAVTVNALLAVHLLEILIWTLALHYGEVIDDISKAAYFAANCYTALGEPFSLPKAWRLVPPIIAISGIFTFAWTASVLVDLVSRYNTMRAEIVSRHHRETTTRTPGA